METNPLRAVWALNNLGRKPKSGNVVRQSGTAEKNRNKSTRNQGTKYMRAVLAQQNALGVQPAARWSDMLKIKLKKKSHRRHYSEKVPKS